ncbi:MAG: Minf_1886 family protein [Verrucomicrobiota bacterium]
MQDLEFSEIVGLICKEDPRFDRKAYNFVRQALDHTVKEVKRRQPERTGKSQHVTGAELLHGIRDYAIEQYGPLAKTVLNAWGVHRCADFGDIVFNLIEYNVFSKTESDRREDFAEIYDFEEAFVKPFLPATGRRPRRSTADQA